MRVKKIDIGIKDMKESLKDFAEAYKSAEAGKPVRKEEGLYFESIDNMRAILTNNRLLLLKAIREHRPHSIYELAKILGRDLKKVNQDLKLLSEIGLVTLEKTETDKKRVKPHVHYAKILLEIPV